MRGAEAKAVGDLAGQALSGTGALVRDVHAAVARRAFEAAGPSSATARAIHDGVSAAVYEAVRAALGALPSCAGTALALRAPADAPSLADSPRGALALAVLNGYAGDALVAGRSELALRMTLRHRGADVDPDAPAVQDAARRVAIFVHGLGETDAAWRLRATADQPGYGELLRRELGHKPLHLRYNTGRHISDNGRVLAALLERLHDAWPTPIDEIVLVGHSMGGLVARSACHYGRVEGHRWTQAVRDVVCLGSPHLGAPVEKGINALGWALDRIPETQPLARVVNQRSAGIKDLRFGRASRRTGATATPTSCSPTAATTSRSCPARPSTSSRRPSAGARAIRWARWSATCSSASRARPARGGGVGSRSASRTAGDSTA